METRPDPFHVRVLVVDDSPDTTETTAILLRLWGYDVRTANDGLTALQIAPEFRPDVVLLDIAMPYLTGWEVVKQLKQIPGLERTLLVAVTGCDRAKDFQRSLEAGFDRHVLKPFDPDELHEVLKARGVAMVHFGRLENAPAEFARA
jgi:CheY-like chemotaxis protein